MQPVLGVSIDVGVIAAVREVAQQNLMRTHPPTREGVESGEVTQPGPLVQICLAMPRPRRVVIAENEMDLAVQLINFAQECGLVPKAHVAEMPDLVMRGDGSVPASDNLRVVFLGGAEAAVLGAADMLEVRVGSEPDSCHVVGTPVSETGVALDDNHG